MYVCTRVDLRTRPGEYYVAHGKEERRRHEIPLVSLRYDPHLGGAKCLEDPREGT